MSDKRTRLSFLPLLLAAALFGSAQKLSATPILNISQPAFSTGMPADSWGWQSFTVSVSSILNTFAFEWNGHTPDLAATATVDLLTGEGTGGALLGSTTGRVVDATVGEYAGYAFFVADFGSVVLALGQYTVYFHNVTSAIQLLGSAKDVSAYSGGRLVTSSYGDWGNDATFFTPSPAGGSGDNVPEPGTLLLLGGSLIGICVGGFLRFRN